MLPEVYVSFASMPKRIDAAERFIRSLESQSLRPTKVFLWMSPFYKRTAETFASQNLPRFLRSHPLVEVGFAEDLGPMTKLYPLLQRVRRDTSLIVTCDDDRILPPRWLEWLVSHPLSGRAALGYRGRRLVRGQPYRDAPILQLERRLGQTLEPVDILTATCGMAMRRSFFDDDFLRDHCNPDTLSPSDPAFFVDDIVINGYLAKKGVERFVIPTPGSIPMTHERGLRGAMSRWTKIGRPHQSLWDLNESGGANDHVVGRFGDYWQASESR